MTKHLQNRQEFDALLKEDKLVVVDFFATWCGPCKMLAPVLETLSSSMDPEKVEFVKVDVDELRDLAIEYSISSVPTMLVFKSGKLVNQLVGFLPEAQLRETLEKLM